MSKPENVVAEKVYQAFHHAKKHVAFHVVSRRCDDPPNAVYLETADGCFLITVKRVTSSDRTCDNCPDVSAHGECFGDECSYEGAIPERGDTK